LLDPILFEFGPIRVHWYGAIMASMFVIGTLLALRFAKKENIDADHILSMVYYIIPLAIIGARTYYVILEWDQYRDNIANAFAIWHGGLAIHGGLIGGFLGGWLYLRKHNLPFYKLADIFIPSVILGQAIGRWGNFFNQEAHGGEVSEAFMDRFPDFIKNQMYIDGAYYHPTFLYESVWDLFVFGILLLLRKYKKFDGQVLAAYFILYSIGRFFVEGLRTDSLMIGPLRMAQVVSIALIIVGIALWFIRRRRTDPTNA
jgi:phosphatidylglycerol:prolipoprotein diacylglycerol transferase